MFDKKAYIRKWKKEHPERVKGYDQKYRKEHPEKKKECMRKYQKEHSEEINGYNRKYRKEHPEKVQEYRRKYRKEHSEEIQKKQREHVLKKRNVAIEQYDQMLTAQDHRCAICEEFFTVAPHIDHCHITGKVRQLLCKKCNLAEGLLSLKAVRNMLSYKERWGII